LSLEIPNLNRPKTRFQDREAHSRGNIFKMVRLEKSFPNVFKKIMIKNHSSVLVFEPAKHEITDKSVERLYNAFCLFIPNKYLLFSQEGMTICTLNSLSEEPFMDITDPLLLSEILSTGDQMHKAQECKKEFTKTVGRTKVNVENICDLEWYCEYINPDFEYILDCAFESIEEQESIKSKL
jgi:hypothetical protein